jgi:RHS repeat-associated protein
LAYPDGSKDVYGFVVSDNLGRFRQAFLSQRVNPQGQSISFNYLAYNPSAPAVRLSSVVDADGRTNSILYTSSNSYGTNLISAVTDPFGRTASFVYNNNGDLTNITDAAGNSSSMAYDFNDWVTNLTTPYGTTSFQLGDGTNSTVPDGRFVLVTLPNSGHELYLFENDVVGLRSYYSTTPNTAPFANTFANGPFEQVNSFYWGPRQYTALSSTNVLNLTTADFLKARMRHWLWKWDPSFVTYDVDQTLGLEREPSPDLGGTIEGQATWYDYSGKSAAAYAGTNSEPLFVARILPDGSTSYVRTDRNVLGAVVQTVATYTGGVRTNFFNYDANGIDLLTVTNALGVMVFGNSYNSYHQVLVHSNALGEVATFTYNANQQLTSLTLPSGLVTTNIYGSDNSLSQRIMIGFATNSYTYSNDLVATHTEARGLAVGFTWDGLSRLTSAHFPDGSYVSNFFTNLDVTATRDRLGNWTTFGYDNMQRNTSVTNALGNVTSFGYCVCGALDSIRDAAGNLTSFFYDNQGNLTNTVFADGYSVQRSLNLLRQVVTTTDSSGNSATNTYNNQGLVTLVKNAAGTLAAYAYDVLDRVTNSTDVNGVSVGTSYDNLGRPLARAYPDGGRDAFGYTPNITAYTSYTNQIGSVVLCAYDPLGRKTNQVFVGVSTNQFAFDGPGALMSITDGRNQITTWNYDQFGRVTNKVDAAGVVDFVYQYDAAGRLTNRWTPANGNAGYVYDAVGNRTSINYAGGTSIAFAYDPLNRMTNMVDSLGTTHFSYDSAGELLSAGGLWSGDTVNYTYNNRLRASLALSGWTNTYSYDAAGRLTNLTSGAGAFGYAYDSTRLAQVAKLSLPNSAYVANSYDSVARLTGTYLNNSANNILDGYTYTYDPLGQRTNIARNFGIATSTVSIGYDPIGQLNLWVAREANGTGRMNEALQYTYDPAGNLLQRFNNFLIQNFNVDAANQLTNIARTGQLTVTGNTPTPASSVTVNGWPAQTYADFTFASLYGYTLADGQNSFTNVATNYYGTASVTNVVTANLPASLTLQYDPNGNLTNDGSRSFSYDAENQLTNVTVFGQWREDFLYDGLNRRRIIRGYAWQSGAWTLTNEVRFNYDGNRVITELDSNNVAHINYTRGLGWLLARTDTTGSCFYHADGNRNVTALMDGSQYIAARYLYDPFGKLLGKWGTLADANVYRFSSKEADSIAGFYYCGRRFYDPTFQRWLSRDPISESGGINLYGYCGNNPVSFYDPQGLCWWNWYDNLAKWAQGESALSKAYLDNNAPTWLATILETASDIGTGILALPSQLGHLGEATGNTGYIGDEPLFQPIANLGVGTGTYFGNPTLANSAGLFQDISVFLGIAATAVGSTSFGSISVGTAAPEETLTLYRGVNESHVFYEDAQAGIVRPSGGTATPLEHNTVPGATLNSPFTSWTTDPAVAENFALRPGGQGVVIEAKVPVSQITPSPNLKNVLLIQNGQIVSESEVLVRGLVQGTAKKATLP